MNFILKSRKIRRFFDIFFARAQSRISERNLAAQKKAERPVVAWLERPVSTDFSAFYTFHDHRCPDVAAIPTLQWWCSHFRGRYRLHLESDDELAYRCRCEGNAFHLQSDSDPGTWIYLVSRAVLPTTYAIEFNYTPHAVFKEQLQLDFAATSLAERHRFILIYNERLRYQRIVRGFLLEDVAVTPCALDLDVPSHIRLEVAERIFSFLVNGRLVACWRDDGYRPRPARSFLLFWNGADARAMDFHISDFRVFYPCQESKT